MENFCGQCRIRGQQHWSVSGVCSTTTKQWLRLYSVALLKRSARSDQQQHNVPHCYHQSVGYLGWSVVFSACHAHLYYASPSCFRYTHPHPCMYRRCDDFFFFEGRRCDELWCPLERLDPEHLVVRVGPMGLVPTSDVPLE